MIVVGRIVKPSKYGPWGGGGVIYRKCKGFRLSPGANKLSVMVCLYISGSKADFLYVINCFDCLSWCALRLLLLVCQDWLFAEKNPN